MSKDKNIDSSRECVEGVVDIKSAILEECNKVAASNGDVFVTFPSPNGNYEFKIRASLKNSVLAKITEKIDFKIKSKKGVLDEYSNDTIEAAVWIEECVVEPKFDFDEALLLAENSGFWTSSIKNYIQNNCGISGKLVEKLTEEFKDSPFVESIQKHA